MDTLSIVLNSIFLYSLAVNITASMIMIMDDADMVFTAYAINFMTIAVILIVWFARML